MKKVLKNFFFSAENDETSVFFNLITIGKIIV